MEDIDFDILPNGEIRFNRSDVKSNEAMLDILISILDDSQKIHEIREFMDEAADIEQILGDKSFCG